MVNLLPQKEQRTLRTGYYLRLGTATVLLLSVVVVVGAALLIPSYFLAQGESVSFERYLIALEETVGLKEREISGNEVSRIAERSRIMEEFANDPVSPDIIASLVGNVPQGVSVQSLAFSLQGATAEVSVSGTATTREALLAYEQALEQEALLDAVDLPVSSLVSGSDISFSVTATFTKTAP